MAKKQKASRIIVGALGIGVLIAVIVPVMVFAGFGLGVLVAVIFPVMFFVFGVGNADVIPQADADQFEIPIVQPPIVQPPPPPEQKSYTFYCQNLGGVGFPDDIFCNYNDSVTKDALLASLEEP